MDIFILADQSSIYAKCHPDDDSPIKLPFYCFFLFIMLREHLPILPSLSLVGEARNYVRSSISQWALSLNHLNPGPFDLKPSALAIELCCYTVSRL